MARWWSPSTTKCSGELGPWSRPSSWSLVMPVVRAPSGRASRAARSSSAKHGDVVPVLVDPVVEPDELDTLEHPRRDAGRDGLGAREGSGAELGRGRRTCPDPATSSSGWPRGRRARWRAVTGTDDVDGWRPGPRGVRSGGPRGLEGTGEPTTFLRLECGLLTACQRHVLLRTTATAAATSASMVAAPGGEGPRGPRGGTGGTEGRPLPDGLLEVDLRALDAAGAPRLALALLAGGRRRVRPGGGEHHDPGEVVHPDDEDERDAERLGGRLRPWCRPAGRSRAA